VNYPTLLAHGCHSDRLEDVFTDAITLVDSGELRTLKQEVLGNA
jgi:hypothetical protein